jgi:hypothetical protein
MRAHLTATVSAIGPAGITGHDWVNASSSLYFYLDPIDPNVSYRTASGRTYFTPPEATGTVALTYLLKPNGQLIDRFVVNLRSHGTLQVVLLTTAEPGFDALAAEASSITIGDPADAARARPGMISYGDVDADGDTDLVMQFSIPQLVAAGVVHRGTAALQIAGQLASGALFLGSEHLVMIK